MSSKQTNRYEFYRNLPVIAPSLLSSFQKLDQSPDNPRCHFELGEAALQAGLLDLSVECFVTVTELAPRVDAGFFNLGNAYFELGQYSKARIAYEQALVLNPDCDTLNNLGNTFAAMEDWQNAIQTFDRALDSASSPVQIRTAVRNRGKALQASSDWEGAIENYRQATLQFAKDSQFLMLKAICHQQVFEYGQAIECLVEALEVAPGNPDLLCEIANVNFCRGRTLESLMCMQHAFNIAKPPANLYSRWIQMLTFCDSVSTERLFNEACQWAASVAQTSGSSSPSRNIAECKEAEPLSKGTMRVGILCQSLPTRGIGDWLADCLGNCNPDRFQWFIFCNAAAKQEILAKFARSGCHVEVTSQLSDADLASMISDLQLALIIDMIGHGLTNRLQVIARSPAEIQVSWSAFPMTSGLKQMGFIWSDQIAIPQEAESFFSEQVLRFPTSSLCFRPTCSLELQTRSRDSMASFRCGFLGRPQQISDPLIATMQSILDSIPNAELVFIGAAYQDAMFQAEIREKLAPNAAASGRILFECFESDVDELNSYQQLDVTLESFLVNSPQRSFESLWMGIPVITHLDERLSGRSTASILHALQCDEWIAKTPNEYVLAVKRLAEPYSDRQTQRERLRNELLKSPMCDTKLIAANIEYAIDETVRRFQFGTNPR
jgi:protein O-GlcNAc transferase